jgi:hypothetical protein
MRIARTIRTVTVLGLDLSGMITRALIVGSLLILSLHPTSADAASISYANTVDPATGTTFTEIKESSGTDAVPLYGPPTAFTTGLDFEPSSFVAVSTGGGVDFTDGQLNFTITSPLAINSLSLFEAGGYSLVGAGTPATSVFAGALMLAKVTHIEGVDVPDINLAPSNASFSDSLPGTTVLAPWSLGVTIDVAAQLAGLGFPANQDATRIEVVINNQLIAISEEASGAIIDKKEFTLTADVDVPEPGTAILMALAVGLLAVASRRKV